MYSVWRITYLDTQRNEKKNNICFFACSGYWDIILYFKWIKDLWRSQRCWLHSLLIQTRFSQNSVCRANLTRKCPQQSLYQVWDKNSRNWNNGSHLKFSLKRFLLITGHCTTELLLFIYCTGKLSVHSSEMLSRISKLINWV